MRLLEILRLRVKALVSSRRLDQELDEEVQFHLEREAEDLVKQGTPSAEARRLARRSFGAELAIKEESRQARGLRWWDEFAQDFRYSLRSLASTPAVTIAALVTLALGIGANTAVFSVVYSVILRPLPFPDPSGLVWVTQHFPRFNARLVSGNDFLSWEEQSTKFQNLAAWSVGSYSVRSQAAAERRRGVSVSQGFFTALDVRPVTGRLFLPDEQALGKAAVVAIGERLWRERFASQSTAIGQVLNINRQPHTIVGVIPEAVENVERGDFWIPLRLVHADVGERMSLIRVLGRLKPGVSIEEARAELQVIARRSQQEQFGDASDSSAELVPLHEKRVGNVRQTLLLLWAGVGLVLVLVCLNVANLLLSRIADRASEISLKLSLGASRFRLVRQLLTESLILSLAGASAGVLLAAKGMPDLLQLFHSTLPRLETVPVSAEALWFTFCIAVVASVAFGILPALRATKTSLSQVLNSSSRTLAGGRGSNRLQDWLVVAQFAIAAVIVFAAATLAHTLVNLRAIPTGFSPDGLVTAEVQLSAEHFRDAGQQQTLFRQALKQIRAIPGVSHAAVSTGLPFSMLDGSIAFFSVDGQPAWGREEAPMHRTRVHYVASEFFATLGIPLRDGHNSLSEDEVSDLRPVVVSEAFAARAFGSKSPLGQRIKLGIPEGPDPWLTVVGVASNVRQSTVEVDDAPVLYRGYAEASNLLSAAFVVRSLGDPGIVSAEVRSTVTELESGVPLHGVATMNQRMSQSISSERERAVLFGGFAALAAVLAGTGIFGLLSHVVARQRPELAVRMALGAEKQDLLWMVLRRGLGRAAIGAACGCIAAIPATKVLGRFLVGVPAIDLISLLGAAGTLMVVALGCCYLPASQAARLDPATILRLE